MVGENLRKALDWLPQARELLTIKCDVELPVKVQDLALRPPDTAKLAELFDRFGFKSLAARVGGRAPGARRKSRRSRRAATGAGDRSSRLVDSLTDRAATKPY